MFLRILFLLILLHTGLLPAHAQKKYQSLMWKITGNGMTKPSYMYGTMHISGKMVFHLGDPFYKAMKEVDVVALELEPEAWLDAIFEDKSRELYTTGNTKWKSEFGFDNSGSVPDLIGYFGLNTDIPQRVKETLMFDPALLNYLLFRSGKYGMSADYEENTWLDMHIYQSGKKLGKNTFGLETYQQSSYYMKQARKEELNEDEKKYYDEKDRKELEQLTAQLEPAYRRQDLDLIDSLNKKTTSASFDKYILVERNKVFVANMDSLMKTGKSIFAGMGCAHLPGSNGVIEMLREMGYTVEPYNKGEHGGKERTKLEKQIFKRNYQTYTSKDKTLSFTSPAAVYPMGGDQDGTSWLSLDIPNSGSFFVTSIRSYAGMKKLSTNQQLASIDSILYESVAGTLVSKKKIVLQGHHGFDIINKTRKGDYQRSQIIVLPEAVLILRVASTGDKIKNGYGDEFFTSVKINMPVAKAGSVWTSSDGSIAIELPGQVISYNNSNEESTEGDFTTTSFDAATGTFYLSQRHTVTDPGFIDEDTYEVNRFADVYKEDNTLKEVSRRNIAHKQLPAVKAKFTNSQNKSIYSLFVLQNLNYCVFTAITEDSLIADKYFNSVKFSLPVYTKYYEYADTTCHFKVQIPYEPKTKESEEEEEYNWYFSSKEEDKNIFYGKKAQTTLSVPGNAEAVDIFFQRYHRFSDGDDSLAFVKNREEYIVKNDLKIDRKEVTWNDKGVIIEHLLSDTASVRKKWVKQILYNKSLYLLESNYDSILGPSDFIKTVYKTFESTDTVFAYYHFRNMDNEYLDALLSADSTTQVNARAMSSDIDFSAAVTPRIRTILRNMPPTKDDEQKAYIKESLTYGLQYDTTLANINFIKEEYYKNMDSAYYQMDLLRTLQLMKTKDATLALKQLILDEPPIVDGEYIDDSFTLANDSLKLCKLLMPDAMNLISLNEYENIIYTMAATLMDSTLISPKMIESDLPQILMEAKNELKRLNATNEDEYGINSYMLLNYCRLLQPFRNKAEVTTFFSKAYSTKKTMLLHDLAEFDLQHKVAVPDSVFSRIIAKENRILPLYEMMYEQKITERFPAKYNSREKLLKLYIKESYRHKYDKTITVDSIDIFLKKEDTLRGDKLDVYYCKYKRSDSKQWKGVIFMFDAKDTANLWPNFIESSKTIVLDEHENDIEEMDIEYKKLIERNRKKRNFGNGYESDDFDWY